MVFWIRLSGYVFILCFYGYLVSNSNACRHQSFPITDILAIPATLRNIQRSLRRIVMHPQAMILTSIFSSTLPCDMIPHQPHLPMTNINFYDTNTAIVDFNNAHSHSRTHDTLAQSALALTHTFTKRHPSYRTFLYPPFPCFLFYLCSLGSYHRKIVIYLYACFLTKQRLLYL